MIEKPKRSIFSYKRTFIILAILAFIYPIICNVILRKVEIEDVHLYRCDKNVLFALDIAIIIIKILQLILPIIILVFGIIYAVKHKERERKKSDIIMVLIIIILFLLCFIVMGMYNDSRFCDSVKNNFFNHISTSKIKGTTIKTIAKKEISTDNSLDEVKNKKYKITNKEELDVFKKRYSFLGLDKYYKKNSTIFIETRPESSVSIDLELRKVVNYDGKLEFVVYKRSEEVILPTMNYWFLIAVVSNDELKNIDLDDWKSPIEAKNTN